MPHSASAKKRHRQNLRNRDRHRIVKSELRSKIRKVLESISTGAGDAVDGTHVNVFNDLRKQLA